jgi:MoaA/NifB/PqqE/SkfB family radical SAM enzyme
MKTVTGWRLKMAKVRVLGDLWNPKLGPFLGMKALIALLRLRSQVRGSRKTYKYVQAGGRYYWDLNVPGWPSPALKAFLPDAMAMALHGGPGNRLSLALLAVTKSCPLHCEHCFEGQSLNQKNGPSTETWERAIIKLQEYGVGQIHLTGGEPLSNYSRLLSLLAYAQPKTDFWVLTSGVGLTADRAAELRRHGLTGIMISLDNDREVDHDTFRGFAGAYQAALAAADYAAQAGLATAFSLCINPKWISAGQLTEKLFSYARLAAEHHVGFVQLLEPRAVGNYAGKNVELTSEAITQLERFYESVNFEKKHAHLPIIAYPAYQQRRVGCSGAGQRYFYADTDGSVHSCPFCQHIMGSLFKDDIAHLVAQLRQGSCARFPTYSKGHAIAHHRT